MASRLRPPGPPRTSGHGLVYDGKAASSETPCTGPPTACEKLCCRPDLCYLRSQTLIFPMASSGALSRVREQRGRKNRKQPIIIACPRQVCMQTGRHWSRSSVLPELKARHSTSVSVKWPRPYSQSSKATQPLDRQEGVDQSSSVSCAPRLHP